MGVKLFQGIRLKLEMTFLTCVLCNSHGQACCLAAFASHRRSGGSPVATGGFGGLRPPNKGPSPLNWNMKHYKLVEFLSHLNVKLPCTNVKPLRTNYWRLDDFLVMVLSGGLWLLLLYLLFITWACLGRVAESEVKFPTPTPRKNLRLLVTPTPQPCFGLAGYTCTIRERTQLASRTETGSMASIDLCLMVLTNSTSAFVVDNTCLHKTTVCTADRF